MVIHNANVCPQYKVNPNSKCQEFIFCFNTNKYLLSCGSGSVFNLEMKGCDHPKNINYPKGSSKYVFKKLELK